MHGKKILVLSFFISFIFCLSSCKSFDNEIEELINLQLNDLDLYDYQTLYTCFESLGYQQSSTCYINEKIGFLYVLNYDFENKCLYLSIQKKYLKKWKKEKINKITKILTKKYGKPNNNEWHVEGKSIYFDGSLDEQFSPIIIISYPAQ